MLEPEIPIASATIGHNSGDDLLAQMRSEQAAAWHDTARVDGKTWADRRAEFLLSASRQVVKDRYTAGQASDTIKLAAAVKEEVMADRFARTELHYRIHRELSEMANTAWAPVDEAMAGLKAQIDQWQREEDVRVEQQQREQNDMLAKLRAAAAPAPPPAAEPAPGRAYLDYTDRTPAVQSVAPAMQPAKRKTIRGDLGSKITQVDSTQYEIEDYGLIPAYIMQSPAVTEAILSVVKRTAKQLGVPAGIRAIADTTSRIS